MPQHIHCTVNNCYYWETGNICLAEEILITSDRVATQYGESVDANAVKELAEQSGLTPAENAMETCCKTFRLRSKGEGSVRRLTLQQLRA